MNNKYSTLTVFHLLIVMVLSYSFPCVGQSMINRNYTWHYQAWARYDGTVDFQMRFGNDTIINGKTYTVFSTISSSYIRPNQEKKELGEGAKFFMREEGQKVYLYNPENSSGVQYDYSAGWPFDTDECLLYDFSLEKGSEFETISACLGSKLKAKVLDVMEKISNDGKKYLCQILRYRLEDDREVGIEVIINEDFGPILNSEGTLAGLELFPIAGPPGFCPPYPYPFGRTKLVRITDIAGNTVYDKNTFAHIEGVQIQNNSLAHPIYSLQGLPVTNPQPGQIYIRNGKKFVMPK